MFKTYRKMHTKKMLRLDISNMVQAIDKLYLQIHESSFHQLELFSQTKRSASCLSVRMNGWDSKLSMHSFE